MGDAFGFTLDQYLYFGGYPGAAPLVDEPERWCRYIADSLIETSISRDVLLSGLQKYAGDAARSRGGSPPCQRGRLIAIEVKSAAGRLTSGAAEFAAAFRPHRTLLVGGDGIALEEFLARPVSHWIRQ